jgi:DNA-binding response OmpR family regulator
MTRSLPLLLVQGKGVADYAVMAVRLSPRVHLVHLDEQQGVSPTFMARAARATIVATARDPIEELVYVRTSGFVGPLVLAIEPAYAEMRGALLEAGVLEVLILPIVDVELDRVLDVVQALPLPAHRYEPLGLLLDWEDHTASRGGASVRLAQREFALLHLLVQNGSRPVSVKEILDHVWGSHDSASGTSELVEATVSRLKEKLSEIGLTDAIETYPGFGYGLAREPWDVRSGEWSG